MTWRNDFKAWALANVGRIWYCWDTQDLEAGLADCSGLVIEALKRLGRLPEKDALGRPWDNNAQGLADRFRIDAGADPEPGDLVFYGSSWENVSHVVFYFGPLELAPGVYWAESVCGMWGGDRSVVGEVGRLIGAGFAFKKSPRWMKNLLGIRKAV